MKAKKSQMTLFIVVGIFILILASLIFYLKGYSTKRQIQKEVTLTQQESERSKPLRTFVEQCMEKQSKDGLLLAGKQGGYTFNTTGQKGMTNISVGIENEDYINVTVSGIKVHVPFFVKENGNEAFPLQALEDVSQSIDEQLEVFINNTIRDCADFSSFQNQGIYVNSSEKNASIEINEDNIIAELMFPLDAEYKKIGQKESIGGFSTKVDVRLVDIYGLVQGTILPEINANPSQPITDTQANTWSSILPFVTVEIDRSLPPYDLVKITDTNPGYNVRGEQFSFWFVKDNWV